MNRPLLAGSARWCSSLDALSSALGISLSTTKMLTARGDIRKGANGYDIEKAREALAVHREHVATKRARRTPYAVAAEAGAVGDDLGAQVVRARMLREIDEARKQKALADERELKVRRMREELFERASVEHAWREMRQFILNRLEAFEAGMEPADREKYGAQVRQMCEEFQSFAEKLPMEYAK